jgi:hypothetical protein
LLVKLGINYLVANGLIVILLTPANYILGHWWTFAARDQPSLDDLQDGDHDLRWGTVQDARIPQVAAPRFVEVPSSYIRDPHALSRAGSDRGWA